MENSIQDLTATVNMQQEDNHPQSSLASPSAVAAAAVTSSTGGESDLPPTPATVTSSSPNTPSSSSAFQPYQQQLHEAMLAAVNSHGIPSFTSHNLIAAAAAVAAAAAAAAASASPTPSPHDPTGSPTQPSRPRQEIDVAKRDSIRAANRERKKKWRIHNEERNKDNDLRCRVNKRATKLFGQNDSEAKNKWAQEEFEKRRQKRMEKERRKNMIDNVLSVPGSPNHASPTSSISPQSPQQQHHHQQQQQDAAAAAAAIAASLASAAATAAAGTPSTTVAADQLGYYMPPPPAVVDTSAAAKMLDFPPELQRQLLEQLNNMIAMTNAGKLTTATSDFGQPQPSDNTQTSEGGGEVGTLQQQVPSSATDMVHEAKTDMLQDEQGLSIGASSSSSNSGQNSPLQLTQSSAAVHQEMTGSDSAVAAATSNEQQQSENSPEMKEDKKPEYPMDAVLTLMQLNAGWRQ